LVKATHMLSVEAVDRLSETVALEHCSLCVWERGYLTEPSAISVAIAVAISVAIAVAIAVFDHDRCSNTNEISSVTRRVCFTTQTLRYFCSAQGLSFGV